MSDWSLEELCHGSYSLVVHCFEAAYESGRDDTEAIRYLEKIAEPLMQFTMEITLI